MTAMTNNKVSRAAGAIGVACASMLLTTACGSTGAAKGGDLLTPDQAKATLSSMLQTLKTTTQVVQHEGGSLRAVDQAQLTVNPPTPGADSSTHNPTVWVAHQTSYPLSFLAYDRPTDPNAKAGQILLPILYHLTKPTESAPWTIDYFMPVPSVPDVALTSDGYAQVIPESRYGALLTPPTNLAADYAAYRTAANSADGHEFAAGSQTTDVIERDNKNVRQAEQQSGVKVSFTYAATGDPAVAYLMKDGSALVLFGIRETLHVAYQKTPLVVTGRGNGITQPAAGTYRATDQDVAQLYAVIDPPKTGTEKVSVIASWGGPLRFTGTPG